MKLSYRGVNYESCPNSLEVTESEILGKYRGQNWKAHYARHIPVPDVAVNLKYRGANYCVGKTAECSLASELAATVKERKLCTNNSRQQILSEAERLHQANIRRSLEHRLEVARAKGDQNLITQLEAESRQLVSY